MQVESTFSIVEAERIIRDLDGRETDTRLTLPTHSRRHAAGGEPAVAQAVMSWSLGQRHPLIATYADEAEDGQAQRLSRHLVGLIAALVCDEALDSHGRLMTTELQRLALERLVGLQGKEPDRWSRGPQVEILCADHLGRPTPSTLYATSRPGQPLLSRREFIDVAELILSRTVGHPAHAARDERLRTGVADVVYELFKNTDDYARTDSRGDRIARSFRGVHARRHAVTPAALGKIVEAAPPLAAYCRRLAPREGRRDIQLLEISVFDTGPGYAAHWLRRPLDEIARDDERDAVRTCFRKHASGRGSTTSGMGLCTVVDILRRRNGFMRLRTGRQSLYADLGLEADRAYGDPPELRAWQQHGLPAAAGTLFTMMMPV